MTVEEFDKMTPEERLRAEVDKLIVELKEKNDQIESIKAELEFTVEINKELSAEVEALTKNAPAAKEISARTISGETFTVDNATYGFSYAKMQHRGNLITASEVLASEELQRELVTMKSGMVKLMQVDLNK